LRDHAHRGENFGSPILDWVTMTRQATRSNPSFGEFASEWLAIRDLELDALGPQEVDRYKALRRLYASLRFALGDDPVYVAEQLGHTDPTFSMRVYAKAIRRRDRLSGAALEEFETAVAWAGRNAVRD
jgi:integrase